MALVIETGVPASPYVKPNSYASVAEFVAFYTLRNDLTAAEADNEVIEAALVFAFDYLIQKYRMRWRGSRVGAFQAGDWPRRGVPVPDFFDPFYQNVGVPYAFQNTVYIPENVIPDEVKDAQMLLARQSITSSTTQESLLTAVGRVTKREKLGALEVEYFDGAGGGARQTTEYLDAVGRITPFLNPTMSGTALRA